MLNLEHQIFGDILSSYEYFPQPAIVTGRFWRHEALFSEFSDRM